MSLQAFKATDSDEAKVTQAFVPQLSLISSDLDEFFAGIFEAYPLGDVLWETGHPLAGVLRQDVLRTSYPAIHQLFSRAGTFEFYLSVFRSVWGDTVDITFTVPDPGKLEIGIAALSAEEDIAEARQIESGAYVDYDFITEGGDTLIFQGSGGIKTQRETDALVQELYPDGVWVEATLSII